MEGERPYGINRSDYNAERSGSKDKRGSEQSDPLNARQPGYPKNQ